MALHKKTVYARVSNPDGTFLKTWFNIDFRGYTKTLNGGVGECVFGLAVPFDYDGAELREGNDVEIVLRDADTIADTSDPTGVRTIYKGYISMTERAIDGNSETVTVHLLGYYTLLALDVLKSGAHTTLYSNSSAGFNQSAGSQNAADIGKMVRSTIDLFNNVRTSDLLFYDIGDIPDTGTTAEYTFFQKTYREAIDALKSLAPENVYWYINEVGRVQFKRGPDAPTHTFIFGRHIAKIHTERSLEKLRNAALLWDGASSYRHYEDAASIATYGRRAERINDYGIADTDAADAVAAKFLAENKDPSVKVVVTITDNSLQNDI